MRIALVISSLAMGGAERVLSLLANAWAARGEEVVLITIDSAAADAYTLDARVERVALGLTCDSRGVRSAFVNNWRRIAALRRALKACKPHAVLSFGECTNVQVLLATRLLRLRCVVSERTDPARHRIPFVWRILRRLVYPAADALVVQTKALLPWARALVGRTRAHAIPNPVRDMTPFAEVHETAHALVIAAVGRLVPAKNFDLLIAAFARIVPQAPDWALVIVGDGPERGALTALAQRLGVAARVRLTGWMAEPGEALAHADIFVLPSRYEGFPNALLEAMACGVPVIASACTGAADIVQNGVNGVLVEVGSETQLASALLRLMRDARLRLVLGRQARTVVGRYRLDAVLAEWDALLGSDRAKLQPALRRAAAGGR